MKSLRQVWHCSIQYEACYMQHSLKHTSAHNSSRLDNKERVMTQRSTRAELKQLWTPRVHSDPFCVCLTHDLYRNLLPLWGTRRGAPYLWHIFGGPLQRDASVSLTMRCTVAMQSLSRKEKSRLRFLLPLIVSSQVATLVTAVYHPASNELSPHILIVSPELWKQSSVNHQHGFQAQRKKRRFLNNP